MRCLLDPCEVTFAEDFAGHQVISDTVHLSPTSSRIISTLHGKTLHLILIHSLVVVSIFKTRTYLLLYKTARFFTQ